MIEKEKMPSVDGSFYVLEFASGAVYFFEKMGQVKGFLNSPAFEQSILENGDIELLEFYSDKSQYPCRMDYKKFIKNRGVQDGK